MMAIIRLLIGLILTICLAGIAVQNLDTVPFVYSPIHEAITLPLYFILLGAFFIGFLLGGVVVWFNEGRTRRDKRKCLRDNKLLEKEVSRLKDNQRDEKIIASQSIQTLPVIAAENA